MVEMTLVAREAITPTNQSPAFNIVAWVLEVTTLFAVVLKVTLLQTSIGLHWDDWCLLVAAVLSIGQVIAASFQSFNGIGKVQSSLSQSNLTTYQKAGYAGELLFILALLASKLSVTLFIYHVTPFDFYRRITLGIGFFIIVWSLASLFATAFQCHSPNEWAFVEGQCIDLTAFWTSYACINMVTELALVILPLQLFYKNISDVSRRIILMCCFSLRLVVVAGIAVQIYYIYHPVYPTTSSTSSPEDSGFTFTTWPVFLTAQIIQSLSIITTCLPFMKTLLVGLETGMFQTGHVSTRSRSASRSQRTNPGVLETPDEGGWLSGSMSSASTRLMGHSFDDGSARTSTTQQVSENPTTSRGTVGASRTTTRTGSITWADDPNFYRSANPREVSMIREEEESLTGNRTSRTSRNSAASRNPYILDVNIPSGCLLFPDMYGEEGDLSAADPCLGPPKPETNLRNSWDLHMSWD